LIQKNGIAFYGTGVNEYNTNNTVHAEMNAVKSLKKRIKTKKVDIIVFRTNKTASSLLCSKPCQNCVNGVWKTLSQKNYKLNKFYYINYDGDVEYYKCSTLPRTI
jgi:cytidine deaminase